MNLDIPDISDIPEPPVSAVCAKGAHGFCSKNLATCGCSECHFICSRCLSDCRRLYGEDSLCPACYRAQPRTVVRCEREHCTSKRAYRDPRYGDAYLCSFHHVEAGHELGRAVR